MKILSLPFILIMSITVVYADIQISVRDQDGHTSTFSSNGTTARMNDSQQPGYVLIELASNRFRMVEPASREIMDMGSIRGDEAPTATGAVKVELINKGKGPLIAGYQTNRYQIKANGKNCGTIFGSRKVLSLSGIQEIFNALDQLQSQTQQMASAFRGSRDACEQADMQMSDSYKKTGAPLRMLDEQGQLESEVISINTRASHPPAYYQAPKGYRVTNVQQQMDQARQQNQQTMQQMQNSMPDMNKLMQQMQQQQGLPPEAMEKMKQMQELYKKQFQQQ